MFLLLLASSSWLLSSCDNDNAGHDIIHPAGQNDDPPYPYSWAPGVRNPMMDEHTLCDPIFRTGSIRPKSEYTEALKKRQLRAHPEIKCPGGKMEEDHVWPIEAGGDPKNPMNLSPQCAEPRPGFHEKDLVENFWHRQICAGKMKIDDVKDQLPHWQEIYAREKL